MLRTFGVALVLSISVAEMAQAADCIIAQPNIQFCKRCTTVTIASTPRDTACNGYNFAGPGSPMTAMVGTNIVQHPRNGTLKLEGRGWIYTPKRGFVGQDSFKIERDMIKDGELFVLYLQFNMEVKP